MWEKLWEDKRRHILRNISHPHKHSEQDYGALFNFSEGTTWNASLGCSMWTLLANLLCEKDCKPVCLSVSLFVYAHRGMTHWRWEGKTFSDYPFFTMRVLAGVAAVSCLCPLVVFLCVVSQSCFGTQVGLSPNTNPNPNLHPNPWVKSLPKPTPLPNSSPKRQMSPLKPNQKLRNKSQLKPRLDSMLYLTDNNRFNSNLPSTLSEATSSSNTRVELQHLSKQSSYSRQGLAYQSNTNEEATNTSNNSNQTSKANPKINPKPGIGPLSQPMPKPLSNSKVVNGPKTNSELIPYSSASPALLSNPQAYSKLRPSSQTIMNTKSYSKISSSNSRAQRNQTKLSAIDNDSHHRPKRGWIWNQFFVLEEHIGPEPQYVGKVSYVYGFLWLFFH